MMDNRISKKLTFFSLVFSIGMTLYHSMGPIGAGEIVCNSGVEEFLSAGVDNLRAILGSAAMHYFFFTSAFLLYYNIDDSNWKRKVSSRMMSLGIPYLVWNLPLIIIQLIKNKDIFNIRLLVSRVALYPFIGPSWYLLGLLVLLINVPIYMYINKTGGGAKVHAVICILIILINQYLANLDIYILSADFSEWVPKLIGYVPTYFFGVYCGLCCAEYYTNLVNNKLILVVMFGTSLFTMMKGSGNSVICILFVFSCWYLSDYFIDRINTDKYISVSYTHLTLPTNTC